MDAPDAEAPPDAGFAACLEFDSAQTIVELPAALGGDLTGGGANLIAPGQCDVVNAPFGVESAGPDRVYALAGLSVGTEYVVRLASTEDLSFYVVSGCGGETGPTSGQCLLFQDEATEDAAEVGTFVAEASDAYVVVDYYANGNPGDGAFTLEVYTIGCTAATSCGGTTPVCQDFRCVGCGSDYDCDDPALPLCDEPTYACVAGYTGCVGDDAAENGDDGPAGATELVAGTPIDHAICNSPAAERDFYRFHVDDDGEHWTIALDWSAAVDLDLEVHDAEGRLLGLSYHEEPESIALTYLPAGDYYVDVDYYATSTTNVTVPYTIAATRVTGGDCSSSADCGANSRNQIYRGDCIGAACHPIEGNGALPAGSACDSVSDCDANSRCYSWFFIDDPHENMVCGNYCDDDADCTALGADFVCTDYLLDNFCARKCTSDLDCPTAVLSAPSTPPWAHLSCDVGTGECG